MLRLSPTSCDLANLLVPRHVMEAARYHPTGETIESRASQIPMRQRPQIIITTLGAVGNPDTTGDPPRSRAPMASPVKDATINHPTNETIESRAKRNYFFCILKQGQPQVQGRS